MIFLFINALSYKVKYQISSLQLGLSQTIMLWMGILSVVQFYPIHLFVVLLAITQIMIGQSSHNSDKQQSTRDRYIACMVLAAVGDAIGYRGGSWEFNYSGPSIHRQLKAITKQQGIKGLNVRPQEFPYSDDTVMHIATAKGLIEAQTQSSLNQICTMIAKHYKSCMNFMQGRAPGATCISSAKKLNKEGTNWDVVPFSQRGGGCGASMRAACIGLYFHDNFDKLIEVSIESGRITHHNPLGYLGALVAALFTAFSLSNIHPREWLSLFIKTYLPKAKQYVLGSRQGEKNVNDKNWEFFYTKWVEYAKLRSMSIEVPSDPVFPQNYGVQQRQTAYYEQFSINGWPGALGLDSVMVAYDALLSSLDYCSKNLKQGIPANRWEQVCLRGMLHGGDNDSTGTIVGAWYGALYGFEQVYQSNYINSQGRKQIERLGDLLYDKSHHKLGQKQE